MAEERPPELHLDFQEELFGAAWRRLRGRRWPEGTALFADHEAGLHTVVQAFAGQPVAVRRAEAVGGVLEAAVLLPEGVALGDARANRDFLYLRAALAGALVAARSGGERDAHSGGERDERAWLAQVAQVAGRLAAEHEGFGIRLRAAAALELAVRPAVSSVRGPAAALELDRQRFLQEMAGGAALPAVARRRAARWRRRTALPPLLLCGGPLPPSDLDAARDALEALHDDGPAVAAGATEAEAPAKDAVRRLLLDEDPAREDMPENNFEKVSFAEGYDGGLRRFDAEDDMDEQQDSLDAVDLREVIRGGPEAQSLYRADIGAPGEIPDVHSVLPGERGIPYDEWDHARRRYRRDWAVVYPTAPHGGDPLWAEARRVELAGAARQARRHLERLRTDRVRLGRQLDGDEVDLAALVEERADLRAGRSPRGAVYLRTPRLARDIATTVLLDVSLSSDAWVDDRRVLDLERDAAWVLAEVAHALDDSLQLLAFASNTRNCCRVWQLKGWNESWPACRARLGALRPQGYTRIGPALRHATAELVAHPARRKHLLLVTDARPNDYDRYEGRHGIHDVRQAVVEARRARVAVHALGIDPRSATWLPVMFGVGGWRLVRSPRDLPDALLEAYADA